MQSATQINSRRRRVISQKRNTKKKAVAILGSCTILVCAVLFFTVIHNFSLSKGQDINNSYKSPLPSQLTNRFMVSKPYDNWMPKKNYYPFPPNLPKPSLTASSALSYDLTTNQVLLEKNGEMRLPIASLTKVMTSIIAVENMPLVLPITIPKKAAEIGENSMGLTSGEKISLENLLYGLYLNSGNDAAEAIAEGSPVGRDTFTYLMNKKAEDMGLTNTHFTNPTGLEGDGSQYSTVYDLLTITRYALQNPEIARISSTYEYIIPSSDTHKQYRLFNETNLLTSYPGVKGVKTGFTYEAGYCLITYLEYKGHKIISILLNSDNRRQEMKELLDYSLKVQNIKPPPHG